jgi:pSer/pThr/pTyr-binding forkhead associated (FHA) protein
VPHLVILGGRYNGKKIALERSEIRIGRASEGNHLVLRQESISRTHLRLLVDRSGVHVEDLGSTSGTFVNGTRLAHRQRLCDGDELRVGETSLRFQEDSGDLSPSVKVEETKEAPAPRPPDPLPASPPVKKSPKPSPVSPGWSELQGDSFKRDESRGGFLREELGQRGVVDQWVIHGLVLLGALGLAYLIHVLMSFWLAGD